MLASYPQLTMRQRLFGLLLIDLEIDFYSPAHQRMVKGHIMLPMPVSVPIFFLCPTPEPYGIVSWNFTGGYIILRQYVAKKGWQLVLSPLMSYLPIVKICIAAITPQLHGIKFTKLHRWYRQCVLDKNDNSWFSCQHTPHPVYNTITGIQSQNQWYLNANENV